MRKGSDTLCLPFRNKIRKANPGGSPSLGEANAWQEGRHIWATSELRRGKLLRSSRIRRKRSAGLSRASMASAVARVFCDLINGDAKSSHKSHSISSMSNAGNRDFRALYDLHRREYTGPPIIFGLLDIVSHVHLTVLRMFKV